MKAGIVARADKPEAAALTRSLMEALGTRGVEVLLETRTAEAVGARGVDEQQLGAACDLLVVLGGDGTILRALHRVRGEEWPKAVESIAAGDFRLSARTMLRVELVRGGATAEAFTGLNDAVVSRGQHSQLIKVAVHIDDEELSVYHADGLIVATPTGSTAYSMSAGGPLLLPDSACFVITPICPHVLTNRSTVVSDHARLELRLVGGGPGVTVNVDGQEIRDFGPGDVLRISRAAEKLRLATLPGRTFSGVLRDKLKWSGSNV